MEVIMFYMKFEEKAQWITSQSWWASHVHEGQRSIEGDPTGGPTDSDKCDIGGYHSPACRKKTDAQ